MTAEVSLDGRALRMVTLFFALFVLLQFTSGAILYVVKIGLHPAETLEYYAGSEAMRVVYPERPDRFHRPRSLEGLVKFSVGHLAAFALIAFLCAHLLRSLTPAPRRPTMDRLSLLLFVTAAADIACCFLVALGPAWTRFLRQGAFVAFECCGLVCGALLLRHALRSDTPSNHG